MDIGEKYANAYKKALESGNAFSPEDDVVKGLTERQKQLQVELKNAEAEVAKFKKAFEGNSMVQTITDLEDAMRSASTGITSYATLISKLDVISTKLGIKIGDVETKVDSLGGQ